MNIPINLLAFDRVETLFRLFMYEISEKMNNSDMEDFKFNWTHSISFSQSTVQHRQTCHLILRWNSVTRQRIFQLLKISKKPIYDLHLLIMSFWAVQDREIILRFSSGVVISIFNNFLFSAFVSFNTLHWKFDFKSDSSDRRRCFS